MSCKNEIPALSTFINRRHDLVALANAVVKNHAVAEELVQDSWLKWCSKAYAEADAEPIFKRIVLNLAKDWHRKQKREWARFETYSVVLDNAPDTERVVIARQDLINVIKAMEVLPDRPLHAFRLSRVEGLTYPQIAERMGVATSTAYSLVTQAFVKLTLASQK